MTPFCTGDVSILAAKTNVNRSRSRDGDPGDRVKLQARAGIGMMGETALTQQLACVKGDALELSERSVSGGG